MYLGQRIVETSVTAEAIAEVTQRLADTWEELLQRSATGEFPPRPSPLCGSCAFVHHCPEGLADVERGHPASALRGTEDHYRLGLDRVPAILHPHERADDEKGRGHGQRPASRTPASTPTGSRLMNRASLTMVRHTVLGVLAGDWRPRPAISRPGRLAQDIALRTGRAAGIAAGLCLVLLPVTLAVVLAVMLNAVG